MSNYRFLVASDMDYTLLLPGKPVSPANKEAIRAIREAGGAFTLATGRSFYLTGSYARDLGITVPLITSNGAAISDPVKFCDVESVDFPSFILDSLMKLFTDEGVDATGYSSDGIYYLPNSSRSSFIDSYNASVDADIKVPILKSSDHSFNKFLLIGPSSSVVDKLHSIPGLQIVSSAKNFLDIMMEGTGKGKALQRIASSLDIPVTFALGDSENDLSLLESSDHSIAMADSDPSLLKIADYTTSDCESDGFARAVYEFILPLVH
ncbi:MAG: Cof-type HAD-IIB family hydrolase [Saccharofermentans sp.]|nr:Cof-type HAD-IIB family hydrolase [Saccharofermentans sp.]